jgi:hypothetical protein
MLLNGIWNDRITALGPEGRLFLFSEDDDVRSQRRRASIVNHISKFVSTAAQDGILQVRGYTVDSVLVAMKHSRS